MKGGSAYKMQIRLSFYTIMCNRAKERDCLVAAFFHVTQIYAWDSSSCRIAG